MVSAKFYIGQIILHNRFGYRGVIYGVDPEFSNSEEWYEQVASSRPPKDRPWYHVMVDKSEATTYVAERHLESSEDTQQIEHPQLGLFFHQYDLKRYFLKEKPN